MTDQVILLDEATGEAGDHYIGLDRFGRVVDQRWTDGTNDLDRYAYTYDRNSNRTARVNVLNSDLDEVYSYDDLNRLTENERDGQEHESWDLDVLGNWQTVTTDGTPEERGHNSQNQITSLEYDANGNTVTDQDGRRFTYDAWNHLSAAYDSEETLLETFAYDAAGRRISVAVNGGSTTDYYLSDNWQVIEDRIDDTTTASYVWSSVYVDTMIARDRDTDAYGTLDERLYPTHDANYNTTSLVGADAQTKERYAEDAYGQHVVFTAVWGTLQVTCAHSHGNVFPLSFLSIARSKRKQLSPPFW